ncbi:MAG TPA: PAS domain-containing sensor histidine kinase [Flavitalea sp.]|nr:PAS domain-containing sensor histidine kinase [Flavitalea sp.]
MPIPKGDWIDAAPCLVFGFDDNGIFCFVNNTFSNVLHFDQSELLGLPVHKVFPVSTKIFYNTHLLPLLTLSGEANEVFIFLQTKEGQQVPILINAKRYPAEKLNVCSGIIVKQRQQFERELIRARKTAEQALHENTEVVKAKQLLKEKTELLERSLQNVEGQNRDLSQFYKSVTHELQEPLRKIFFHVDLLQRDAEKFGICADQSLQKLGIAAEKLKYVIGGLQEFAWLSDKTFEYSAISLNELLPRIMSYISAQSYPSTYEISVGQLPSIPGDRDALERLFSLLFQNAIHSSRDGVLNRIKVSAVLLQRNKYNQLIGEYSYTDYWRVTVSDSGKGFDPSMISEIFQLFPKVNLDTAIGAGLALCKKIVEKHAGFLEADSQINEGTTIHIFLPLIH